MKVRAQSKCFFSYLQSGVGNCWPFWRRRIRTSVMFVFLSLVAPSPLSLFHLSRCRVAQARRIVVYVVSMSRRKNVGGAKGVSKLDNGDAQSMSLRSRESAHAMTIAAPLPSSRTHRHISSQTPHAHNHRTLNICPNVARLPHNHKLPRFSNLSYLLVITLPLFLHNLSKW